jgi:hypothetical protein
MILLGQKGEIKTIKTKTKLHYIGTKHIFKTN